MAKSREAPERIADETRPQYATAQTDGVGLRSKQRRIDIQSLSRVKGSAEVIQAGVSATGMTLFARLAVPMARVDQASASKLKAALADTYQAGAEPLWQTRISQVAIRWEKPPKTTTATLYPTEIPVDRTSCGKRSAMAAGAGPAIAATNIAIQS